MLPDRVSNPGPPTYESGALPTALRGPATYARSTGFLLQAWCSEVSAGVDKSILLNKLI